MRVTGMTTLPTRRARLGRDMGGLRPRDAAPAARSAVSATSADSTPGTARTAFSALARTGSQD